MRSKDDQFNEIMRRAENVKKRCRLRKTLAADITSCAVCAALLIAAAALIPRLDISSASLSQSSYASLLLSPPYLSFIIIALLSFSLGICVTLLCLHLKKMRQIDAAGEKHDDT